MFVLNVAGVHEGHISVQHHFFVVAHSFLINSLPLVLFGVIVYSQFRAPSFVEQTFEEVVVEYSLLLS